jgi:hypothetical protein
MYEPTVVPTWHTVRDKGEEKRENAHHLPSSANLVSGSVTNMFANQHPTTIGLFSQPASKAKHGLRAWSLFISPARRIFSY